MREYNITIKNMIGGLHNKGKRKTKSLSIYNQSFQIITVYLLYLQPLLYAMELKNRSTRLLTETIIKLST